MTACVVRMQREFCKNITYLFYFYFLQQFHPGVLYFQLKGIFVKIFIILNRMCISLSGGMLMVPQKHRGASKFIYNSGFYITTNVYPDFGEGLDVQAITKRVKVFETKSLKDKDTSVTGKLHFFLVNQYIFEVDLVHIQYVTNFLRKRLTVEH